MDTLPVSICTALQKPEKAALVGVGHTVYYRQHTDGSRHPRHYHRTSTRGIAGIYAGTEEKKQAGVCISIDHFTDAFGNRNFPVCRYKSKQST